MGDMGPDLDNLGNHSLEDAQKCRPGDDDSEPDFDPIGSSIEELSPGGEGDRNLDAERRSKASKRQDLGTPEPDRKFTYLHRTAKDFLESPDMQQRILSVSPPDFDCHKAILSGYLLLLKTLPAQGVDLVALWRAIVNFLETAAELEASTETSLTEHLDELDRAADIKFRAHGLSEVGCHWITTRRTSADSQNEIGFMALAAEFNLKRYIVSKLELGIPVFTSSDGRPILDYIVEDFPKYPSLCEPSTAVPGRIALPSLRIINMLLNRGEDSNARYKESTTWMRVLEKASKMTKIPTVRDDEKLSLLQHWAAISEAFISHDADPVPNRNSPLATKIREVFGPSMPQRAKEMEKKLKRTRYRWSSIGKFITPRNWKLERLSFETTPLPVLLRMESATMAPLGWSEYLIQRPVVAVENYTRLRPKVENTQMDLGKEDSFGDADILNRRVSEYPVLPDPTSGPEQNSQRDDRAAENRIRNRTHQRNYRRVRRGRAQEDATVNAPSNIPAAFSSYAFGDTPQMFGVPEVTPTISTRLQRIYRLTISSTWSSTLIVSIAEREGILARYVAVRSRAMLLHCDNTADTVQDGYEARWRHLDPPRRLPLENGGQRTPNSERRTHGQHKRPPSKPEKQNTDISTDLPTILAPYILGSGAVEASVGHDEKGKSVEPYSKIGHPTVIEDEDETELAYLARITKIDERDVDTFSKMDLGKEIGRDWRAWKYSPNQQSSSSYLPHHGVGL
jgi:hypothetical protein